MDESVVNLNFMLTDLDGNMLDQSLDGSFTYVHGHGRILHSLERHLLGKEAGENVEVVLPPSEAFGERIEDLTEIAPNHLFKGPVKVGMQFQARTKDGRIMPLKIVRIEGDEIHVDANHPMAGITLYFSVEILGVRPATSEEIRTGLPQGKV